MTGKHSVPLDSEKEKFVIAIIIAVIHKIELKK